MRGILTIHGRAGRDSWRDYVAEGMYIKKVQNSKLKIRVRQGVGTWIGRNLTQYSFQSGLP